MVFPTWRGNDAGAEVFSRHGMKMMSGEQGKSYDWSEVIENKYLEEAEFQI